jgi:predicted dehydrogenase
MKNGTLKIGIIGAGGRGIMSFGELLRKKQGVQIAAFADPNPVRMRESAKRLEIKPNFYESTDKMLAKEKLDAVVITTPDYLHEECSVKSLNAGVNALIDKPLATTVKGCQNIIKAAEKSKKIAMIGFNLRHDPTLLKLKELADKGEFGKIFLIENREFYDGGRTYMSRWNRKYALSGGLWIHKGSHDFDVFNWLLGFPKPVRVSAFAGINVFNPKGIPFEVKKGTKVGPTCGKCAYKTVCPDFYEAGDFVEWSDEAAKVDGYRKDLCMYTSDKDVHDNGTASVEYESGARASHMECFVCSFSDRKYTIVGDRGVAEASLHNREVIFYPRWKRGEVIKIQIGHVEGGHGGADPGLVEKFLRTIKGEIPNTSTAEHGLLSTAIGQAAEISRREERMVYMKELFK